MMGTTTHPPPVRPPNGSRRSKDAYIMLTIFISHPGIRPGQVQNLLGWPDQRFQQAARDMRIMRSEAERSSKR